MSLKEELAKIEQEEESSTEEEERLREIEENIYSLYRRIGVIVEYIDKQTREVTTIEDRYFKEKIIEQSINNARNRWERCLKEANGDLEKARELYGGG